jgi:arginase family enzyme
MHINILDLDGSVSHGWMPADFRSSHVAVGHWGPAIRLSCSFRAFRRFEEDVSSLVEEVHPHGPTISFYGSGDFHHVSLALVRRLTQPFNLLVLDNHPDWMRSIPFLHCGTWLYHAARLPNVKRVFHWGGDVDFDNYYQWMAPWSLLRSGKITVCPAVRRFERGAWATVPHQSVRAQPYLPASASRISDLLAPIRVDLRQYPLYLSLDKDVMCAEHAPVNWDSGHLAIDEVCEIVGAFLQAANGKLAGMDVVGDWSPVRVNGLLRRSMHHLMHPLLSINPDDARRQNERVNRHVLETVRDAVAPNARRSPALSTFS